MANAFGKTWWGQEWLKALSKIDYSNRLPRGASYARKGSVLSMSMNGNQIQAKVAGSRPTPYKIDITVPAFSDREVGFFMKSLAQKPMIISKLLNRELDPEVLKIAEKQGLMVFPQKWSDLRMKCSCPDSAVPCKHLAAVIYKVSAEIDNNPFWAFSLHNMDLLRELNKMNIVIKKETIEIPKITDLLFEKADKKTKKKEYDTENAYQKLSFHKLPHLFAPLTALLAPTPAFYIGSGDFKEKYQNKFARILKKPTRYTSGKMSLGELFPINSREKSSLNTRDTIQLRVDEYLNVKALVQEKKCTFYTLLSQLAQLKPSQIYDYQPSTAFLFSALNLSVNLIEKAAIIPQIVQLPNKQYAVRWLPAILSKEVKELLTQLAEMVPPEVLVWEEKTKELSINKELSFNLLSFFLTEMMEFFAEERTEDTFLNLFFHAKHYAFQKPGEEALAGGIMAWLQKFFITQGEYQPMLVIEEFDEEEMYDNKFIINLNIRKNGSKLAEPIPLPEILTKSKYNEKRFEILQSLAQLSGFISGMDDFINSDGKNKIEMSSKDFAVFLMQMIPAIQLLNIEVLLPKSLREILRPKPSVRISQKKQATSYVRLEQLLDFEWQIAVGDNVLSEREFKELLKNSDGLLKYKSQYIYVNKEDLEKLYKHFAQTQTLTPFQILRTALSESYLGAKISLTEEVAKMISELTNFQEVTLPDGIQANLRPYQKRGFSWMYRNAQIGFGSVLADDMGLGKTLQVITTVLKFKEQGFLEKEKVVVVAPTGLLTNWQAEMEKFSPSLKVHLYHGNNRKLVDLADYDVLLTSYGILRSDVAKLKKVPCHSLVIDEAQNIKNQETAQTKAVKAMKANNFIAMSGTPVENRLSELWSIMDYGNRGFLGNLKEFTTTYGRPIEEFNNKEAAETLKKVSSPFLMRRMKTDKSIISDLPDKIEMDCYATLTSQQAALYKATLEKSMETIEEIDGKEPQALFKRQGLVLQMILALKQICNHPTQFLKNKVLDVSLSGKMDLLFDKLESIIESNEKVLIFTQFTGMGEMLKHFIKERFEEEPLFYHGGCTLNQRKEMVEKFQNNHVDRIFILSLKAAGTGLNLTAATHVIHYDLWWNPAVEAQATDRAYRIGQKTNVMVHRFITKNTFEERINEMIQQKKALAEMTVSTGENWIGNLSNRELRGIFELK